MSDLSWVIALRTETLSQFFGIFPFFASESLYLILIALGYWSWDKKVFKDLAILVCLSTMLNCWLKAIFRIPRPDIEHLVFAQDSFSFPSGDIQVVATFWFALAWHVKHPALWAFAILLTVLVGLSRVYLGVHYPIDVTVGAMVGILLVIMYYTIKNSSLWKLIKQNDILLSLIFFMFLSTYLFDMKDNLNKMSIISTGVLLGVFFGSCLAAKFRDHDLNDSKHRRLAAALIGLPTLFILRAGLMYLWQQSPHLSYVFIIYTILGLHIIFFVPWLVSNSARFLAPSRE